MECVGDAAIEKDVIYTAKRNFWILISGWVSGNSISNSITFYNKSEQEIIIANNSSSAVIKKISTYFIPAGQKFKFYRHNIFEVHCYDYNR